MNSKEKIKALLFGIDKQTFFISTIITFAVAYYFNPLSNTGLSNWDRTFCTAVLHGISIDMRVKNFYLLFFLWLPILILSISVLLSILFMKRKNYKEYFLRLVGIFSFSILASYISRYQNGNNLISRSLIIESYIIFFFALILISIIDSAQVLTFEDITLLCVCFFVGTITIDILQKNGNSVINGLFVALFLVSYVALVIYIPVVNKVLFTSKIYLYIMMWIPTIIWIELERQYYRTEKGICDYRYYTHILLVCIIICFLAFLMNAVLKKTTCNFSNVGYIGAITSTAVIGGFGHSYNYTWSYFDYSNMYEMGNATVAIDSVVNGKIPVVDYYSAHAISDVWTRIVYCVIHRDINGIFADPYSALAEVIAYIILYFIVKNLLDNEMAVLYVLLFPGHIVGIKWISLCGIAVLGLIHIYKVPKIKSYFFFWIVLLLGAFTVYDEGISLGLSCVISYFIVLSIQKKWSCIQRFILSGIGVGISATLVYIAYCYITKVDGVSRAKEWLSLSLGSSSSWATAGFGDQTSFAFLFSYFLVPIIACILLLGVVIDFYQKKENALLAMLTIAYAMTEALFITRTIVYHNLEVCSGITGVLLNYIHWTVSLFALYKISGKIANARRAIIWAGTMLIVIILEGAIVTDKFPDSNSVLLSKGLQKSQEWDICNGYDVVYEKERIIADDDTSIMINRFKTIFDILLLDDETFIDFANVTSLYAMTGRVRPCYVAQTPSLLTDIYSQECYLKEISQYNCPLVVIGTTESPYLQQMAGIPHNIRYYKIAEYIYHHYRPLIGFGEFAVWCDKDNYDYYQVKLINKGIYAENTGYSMIDSDYDMTQIYEDEKKGTILDFKPYHMTDLVDLPFIWANFDDYKAINNSVIISAKEIENNKYLLDSLNELKNAKGIYLAFECDNQSELYCQISSMLSDSKDIGHTFLYYFRVHPGKHSYLIRVSADSFWNTGKIDTIFFDGNEHIRISNVRLLEGD